MLTQIVLLGAMLGQMRGGYYPPQPPVAPMVPATQQYEDFPLHIRVIESRWTFYPRMGNYTGWGHADILGPDGHGFDFTYTCEAPFLYNDMKGQFYEGQWKKPEQQINILLQRVGSNHTEKCTLKTSLRPELYSKDSLTWEPSATPAPPAATPAGQPAPVERKPQ